VTRALVKLLGVALACAAFVWVLYSPNGMTAAYGAEDDPGWECATQGNRICGDDRWVQITQNHGGALSISRQTPQVAARRFYNAPGVVCITVIRRADGTIDRFRLCHA
jgi:hypothetical protein